MKLFHNYLFLTGSGSQKNHASGSETLSVTYSQIHQHFSNSVPSDCCCQSPGCLPPPPPPRLPCKNKNCKLQYAKCAPLRSPTCTIMTLPPTPMAHYRWVWLQLQLPTCVAPGYRITDNL